MICPINNWFSLPVSIIPPPPFLFLPFLVLYFLDFALLSCQSVFLSSTLILSHLSRVAKESSFGWHMFQCFCLALLAISYQIHELGSHLRPEDVARNLFAFLRSSDNDTDVIYVEGVGECHAGAAVMNRIRKAASEKCLIDLSEKA